MIALPPGLCGAGGTRAAQEPNARQGGRGLRGPADGCGTQPWGLSARNGKGGRTDAAAAGECRADDTATTGAGANALHGVTQRVGGQGGGKAGVMFARPSEAPVAAPLYGRGGDATECVCTFEAGGRASAAAAAVVAAAAVQPVMRGGSCSGVGGGAFVVASGDHWGCNGGTEGLHTVYSHVSRGYTLIIVCSLPLRAG